MSRDQMFAKVVLASKPTNGAKPIITIHARYPRIIHGEIMTHRVFSRNARSSRAVPVATMLKEIRETPFVPWHWGKNQKGMQAGEEHNEPVEYVVDGIVEGLSREDAWLEARNHAVRAARNFNEAGYHKQIVNRLIEPFSWIDTLITSTSWANFFHLRDHEAAEPHFHDLAVLVKEAIAGAEFQTLKPGEWHMPYITREDEIAATHYLANKIGSGDPFGVFVPHEYRQKLLLKLSVARCARISYKPFDGDGSIEKELERYDGLVGSSPLHASPAEHQATPDVPALGHEYPVAGWENERFAGNLGPGYIQLRKTLVGEYVAD